MISRRMHYVAALAALVAAMLACDSPFGTSAGVVVVEPDPVLTVSPDDMKLAGEVVRRRLEAADLYHGMEVTGSRLTIHLTRAEDRAAVTALATQPGVLEFFEWDTALPAGSAAPEHGQPILTDKDIASARVDHADAVDEMIVTVLLTPEATKFFAGYLETHIGTILVIAQDGTVLAAPTINTPIPAGSLVIQSDFDRDSAALLANELNAGRLPIRLQVVSVGPNNP